MRGRKRKRKQKGSEKEPKRIQHLDKMRSKSHLEDQVLSQREYNVLPIPTKDYLAKRLQGYRLHLENSVRELESYVIYKNLLRF